MSYSEDSGGEVKTRKTKHRGRATGRLLAKTSEPITTEKVQATGRLKWWIYGTEKKAADPVKRG